MPLIPTAARNSHGYRQATATAMNAPSDAPVAITSAPSSRQSMRIAGTTSCAIASSNRLSRRQRYSIDPVSAANARPARLSHE